MSEEGKLVLDGGEILSELRPLPDTAVGRGRYWMVDPASLGGEFELRLGAEGVPELIFVRPGVPNPDFPGYVFAPLPDPRATPVAGTETETPPITVAADRGSSRC